MNTKAKAMMTVVMILNIIGLVIAAVTYTLGGLVALLDSLASNTVNPVGSTGFFLHTILMYVIGIAILVFSIILKVRLNRVNTKPKALLVTEVVLTAISCALFLFGMYLTHFSMGNMLFVTEIPLFASSGISFILALIALF